MLLLSNMHSIMQKSQEVRFNSLFSFVSEENTLEMNFQHVWYWWTFQYRSHQIIQLFLENKNHFLCKSLRNAESKEEKKS